MKEEVCSFWKGEDCCSVVDIWRASVAKFDGHNSSNSTHSNSGNVVGGGGYGIQAKITVLDAQVSYIKLCFYAIKIRCEAFAVVV